MGCIQAPKESCCFKPSRIALSALIADVYAGCHILLCITSFIEVEAAGENGTGGTDKSIFSFKDKALTAFELNLYSYEYKWAICLEELSAVLCPLAVRSASCGMDGDVKRKQQGGSSTGSQELSGQGSDSHTVG
ncbi:uncharacterized [Tachysurus ichikawai]